MAGDVDKELAKSLQAARKKPRNFAIIAKAPNVLNLIVDKRPIKQGTLSKAKTEYGGNLIIKGVVSGGDDEEGAGLVFQVPEEPKVQDTKLKKFITDETKLTLKVRFQVVAELTEIDDNEPDEAAEPLAVSPPEPVAAPPPPPSGEATRFTARLKALKPGLDKVLAAKVAVSREASRCAGEAAAAAKKPDFAAANQILDRLEALVEQGLEEMARQAAVSGDPAALFNARLRNLMPAIRAAIGGGSPTGAEIKLRTSEAGVFAQKQDFPQANQLLDQVEALLNAAPSPVAAAPAESEDIEEDDEDEAVAALIGGAKPTARVPQGFVDYAKARLAWEAARKRARAELSGLQDAILARCAEEDELPSITQAVKRLDGTLADFDESLGDELDAALSASGAERQAHHVQAASLIRRYRDYVQTDRTWNLLDDNPFQSANIQGLLLSTLEDLDTQLQS